MHKKSIGILGGSFDPVTLAHIHVANTVLENVKLDELWMIPCYNHKFGKDLSAYNDRVEMLSVATETEDDKIKISDIEFRYNLSGSTKELFELLYTEFPDYTFYFIMGQDIADVFNKFEGSEWLKKNVRFIIVSRVGVGTKVLNQWYTKSPNIYLGDIDLFEDISSTNAREYAKLKKYDDLLSQVPIQVLNYVIKNNLYNS